MQKKKIMEVSCPIVNERVDEKLVRINGLIVFIGLSLFVLFSIKWVILLITADFAIRVFFGVKNSPLCHAIKYSLNKVNAQPHLINAGPKKFAAKVGLSLTSIISLLYILNFTESAQIIGIISMIAVGAEVFFNYCVACQIYNILQRLGIKLD